MWEEVGGVVSAATCGARQAAIDAQVARGDPDDLPHALFNGRALGLGGSGEEGQCQTCLDKHASGVCFKALIRCRALDGLSRENGCIAEQLKSSNFQKKWNVSLAAACQHLETAV